MFDTPASPQTARAGSSPDTPDADAATPPAALLPARLDVTAEAMAAALDEIGQGLVIVDVPSARLRHANRQALTDCACHGTLELHDGHVRAPDPADDRALHLALAATTQGRRSLVRLRGCHAEVDAAASADRQLLADAPSKAPGSIAVAVVPLEAQGGWPQAMVVFGRRQVADTLAVGFFSRLHGLTPAEESVLRALCRGRKPAEITQDQGVAISTIRTHVNAIRVKTGAGSIREIAQQVATLPPMAPAARA